MMTHNGSYPKRRIVGLVTFVAVLTAVGFGWLFRQDIADWYRLRQYSPPAEVVALADQTTMTAAGRRIFYAAHPQITGKADFNSHCRQGAASEYSIVLGCFITGSGSFGNLFGELYLYDIDDERLNGVEQVTAAHEMLHAAYNRLSDKERHEIDAQLLAVYRGLPEGRLRATIDQYQANDPAAVPSELHSILGTEKRDLPAALEDYYKQYFENRQTIVGFAEQYETEFARREAQVAAYDAQLAGLKADIDANRRLIEQRNSELQIQRAELDQLEAAGDASGYNALVAVYNANVGAYNALVEQTRADIDEYNRLVEVRNDLALEVQELTEAIDSRLETL